jgi:FixJ family two-component response regulator
MRHFGSNDGPPLQVRGSRMSGITLGRSSSMTPAKSIGFVVDDDVSVRESLELLIQHEGWQPKTFASAQEFLDCPRAPVPNCLLLDISLPGMNGLELQKRIAFERTDMPIIFITGSDDVPNSVQAMKAGAVEFLTKPFNDEVLLTAIRQALERSRLALAQEAEMRELLDRYGSLTPREREVMALVVSGLLNKQIGGELGISEVTVKAHRGQVMQKMKANSVADLVKMAERLRHSPAIKENVRLDERTRIAQELHDTLLQTFLSASMQLGVAVEAVPEESPVKPKLDRVLQIMSRGIEEGRATIQGLRSSDSPARDLVIALSGVEQGLSCRPDIDFRVNVAGRQQPLNPLIQQEVYRIGREALLNAFCHSGAKRVEVRLEYADHNLQMRVNDNGTGIDPQVLRNGRERHFGLAGMKERAARIGGLLKISSSPSNGTEVLLTIPSGIAFQLSATKNGA